MYLGFKSLMVGLLVTVLVHKEITLAQATSDYQELSDKMREEGAGGRKWLTGRKIGMEVRKVLEGTLSTENAKNSSDDLIGSGKTKGSGNSKPRSASSNNKQVNTPDPVSPSEAQQGESQASESSVHASLGSPAGPLTQYTIGRQDQDLQEATAELFKILHKDYHDTARRRPPINN